MSADLLITAAIGLVAAWYVGGLARKSIRRLTAPTRGESACGGCSGCGTPSGHAESEDDCQVRADELITLGKKRPSHAPHRGSL